MKRAVLAASLVVGMSAMALLVWPRARPTAAWRPRIVILLAIDTCRADHLGCYGYRRNTSPNIDRIAAQGVRFERAFSQANESLFSYASLLTGLYPQRIGRLDYERFRLPGRGATLPALLSANGVRTAAFVAGGHLNHAFGFARGFEVYQDKWDFGSLHSTFPAASEWLGSLPRNEKAFVMIQGYDVHAPYINAILGECYDPDYRNGLADEIVSIPDASDNIYNGTYFPSLPTLLWFVQNQAGRRVMDPVVFDRLAALSRRSRGRRLSAADVRHLIAHYDACISYADIYAGLLMARLRQLHLERETLVVLLGDHGEDLMEHGFFNHRDSVCDSCVRVPLIVWGPDGVPGGRVVQQAVQLLDVMPTVLDYEGLPPLSAADGKSLRGTLDGTAQGDMDNPQTYAFSEGILPMTSVRSQSGRLVFYGRSSGPLPRLDDRYYRYYRIASGEREQAAPVHEGAALFNVLLQWRRQLYLKPGSGPTKAN